MYKQDLTLTNLGEMICRKKQPTNQPTKMYNHSSTKY